MKILWILASPIGPASRILNIPYKGSSGTWIQSEYEVLSQSKEFTISYLCPIRSIKDSQIISNITEEGTAYGIGYNTIIPYGNRMSKKQIAAVELVLKKENPDVVHIWGTESSFTSTIATLFPQYKKIIFIQGLIGMHERYTKKLYIKGSKYWNSIDLIQFLKEKIQHYYFKKHIKYEQNAIKSVKYIITDNEFTIAYCASFAPAVTPLFHFLSPNKYYYTKKWDFDNCHKHTIFTIFGIDPTKGLSKLLHVLLIVKDSYHDVKLYIPGPYNIKNGKLLKTVSGFEKWLYNYIEQNNLSENIVFTGKLNIEEMAYYYEKCNIFVSPSCMEVHSGSLREALCVGIPSISSLCGCVGDLIKHGVNGYIYRYEEEEILAFYINKLFANELLAKSFSLLSKECIQKYDYNEKFETLERIYHFINEK